MYRPAANFAPGSQGPGCLARTTPLMLAVLLLLACLYVFSWIPASLAWGLIGRDHPAPVTGTDTYISRRTGEPLYRVHYTLALDGRRLEGTYYVTEAAYQEAVDALAPARRGTSFPAHPPAPTVRIRAVAAGPFYWHHPLRDGDGVWEHVAFTCFTALFAGGILSFFLYLFLVLPWLIERGYLLPRDPRDATPR